MIFLTAYNTAACKGFLESPKMQETIKGLKVAQVNGQLNKLTHTTFTVEGFRGDEIAINSFAHPLVFSTESLYGSTDRTEHLIACDMRPYGHYDSHQDKFIIRNLVDYKFAITRTNLNNIWINNDPSILRNLGEFPMTIYAQWISERLARSFNLDPREQLDVAIVAGIFYYSLFQEELNLVDLRADELKITRKVAMAVNCQAADVTRILKEIMEIQSMNTIHDFCQVIKTMIGIRFENLNAGVLFSLLKNSWYGATNSLEVVCSALEHPPTWLTMLASAISERTFKKSAIALLIERNNRGGVDEQFVRSVLRILSQAT